MGMFRNMEVVLTLCFGLLVAAALFARPSPSDKPLRAEANTAQMPVVVVTGKRLSAAERAQAAQDAG